MNYTTGRTEHLMAFEEALTNAAKKMNDFSDKSAWFVSIAKSTKITVHRIR